MKSNNYRNMIPYKCFRNLLYILLRNLLCSRFCTNLDSRNHMYLCNLYNTHPYIQ